MSRFRFLSFCACVSFACLLHAQDRAGIKAIGIMPVLDTSGEAYGQVFAQNMTAMIYQKLNGASLNVLLLNPGGLYNPIIVESITDYAQTTNVDLVLVTTLLSVTEPKKGDFTLQVEAKLTDPKSGKDLNTFKASYTIPRRDAFIDTGKIRAGTSFFASSFGSSRPFAKQPLGKAASSLADAISGQLLALLPAVKGDTSVSSRSGSCNITIGVNYISKKASSKAYDIIVNSTDQSLWTKEGITKLENFKSGPVLIQLSVADAPYRLPVQELYQANTVLDCSLPERALKLDIGPVGEALLHWH